MTKTASILSCVRLYLYGGWHLWELYCWLKKMDAESSDHRQCLLIVLGNHSQTWELYHSIADILCPPICLEITLTICEKQNAFFLKIKCMFNSVIWSFFSELRREGQIMADYVARNKRFSKTWKKILGKIGSEVNIHQICQV